MEKMKWIMTMLMSALMSWLGILAVPVFLLVGCNLIDYGTGLMAAAKREELVSSYRSVWGIAKKVCQWLMILVGALVDILINYAAEYAGITIKTPFVVATVAAVWLVVNELISILENMIDIGAHIPPFLLPLVRNIRKQVEDKAAAAKNAEEQEDKGNLQNAAIEETESTQNTAGGMRTAAAEFSGEGEEYE